MKAPLTTRVSSRAAQTARDLAEGLTLPRSIMRLRQGGPLPLLGCCNLQLRGPSARCASLGMTATVAQ